MGAKIFAIAGGGGEVRVEEGRELLLVASTTSSIGP